MQWYCVLAEQALENQTWENILNTKWVENVLELCCPMQGTLAMCDFLNLNSNLN